jgi:hypothetical protein
MLTARSASEYSMMVTEWSLSKLLIYLEQRRVYTEWDDMT